MPKRFNQHTGVHLEEAAGGRSRCTLVVEDWHRNGEGVVHGGALFTLADTGMGMALYRTLPPDELCATVEIKMSYFKPVYEGTVVCNTETINRGKRVASMESSLYVNEVLVSKASGTFSIFKRKPAA